MNNAAVMIHRMQVVPQATSTSTNIGTITATAAGDSTITAQITPGIGQTGMAIYGIPSTQTLYIERFYANMNKAAGVGASTGYADVALRVNTAPNVNTTVFLNKHTFGLSLDGTSAFTIPYSKPKIITGPAIVKVQITSGTNNMDISAGFDAYIIDN